MISVQFFAIFIGLMSVSVISQSIVKSPAPLYQEHFLGSIDESIDTEISKKEQEKFVAVAAEELGNIFEILQGLSLYTDKDIDPILTSHGIVPQPKDDSTKEERVIDLRRRGSFSSNFMFAFRGIVNCVAVITREAALINPLLALLATFLGLMNEMIE